jgi:hypothetical protein
MVTGSEVDRKGSATTRILVNKTLGGSVKKGRVSRGHRQRITITGLASAEAITVAYRGKRISPSTAHADASGVYRIAFGVGKQRGSKAIKATGQFPGRIATRTFWVKRR